MPEPELLFGLRETDWGRGLAGEAASAVFRHGFVQLHLPAIGAATDLPNDRSIRLLARLGFRPLGEKRIQGLDTLMFRLTAAAWSAAQSPAASR